LPLRQLLKAASSVPCSGEVAGSMKRAAGAFDIGFAPTKMQNTGGAPTGQGDTWNCNQCGNLNWPLRTVCNNKQCGAARQQSSGQPLPGSANRVSSGNGSFSGSSVGIHAIMSQLQGASPVGSWICLGCQNVNFPLRKTCNNQVCGLPRDQADGGEPEAQDGPTPSGPGAAQPGSWVCTACQNVNFPLRKVCNNKGCALPREQADGGEPTSTGRHTASGPGSAQPGSWVCAGCHNVNFPLRTVCNNKQCGLARDVADAGPPDGADESIGGAYTRAPTSGGAPGMKAKGSLADVMAQAVARGGGGGGGGGGGPAPQPGSWVCASCQNVNFPLRKICNNKVCNLPREDADAGPPPGDTGVPLTHGASGFNGSVGGDHPEGSWACDACGNVNWPKRTTCNNKICGQPKMT